MIRTVAIVVVLSSAGVASAEPGRRETVLSVVGGVQATSDPYSTTAEFEHSPLFGASLRWDRSPPDDDLVAHERRTRGDLAPEATLLADGHDVMALAGLRLELEMEEQGPGPGPRLPVRIGIWIAPRIGVSTAAGSLVLGGDGGATVYRHSGWTVSFYTGAYVWRAPEALPCACLAFDPTGGDSAGPHVLQAQMGLIIGSPL